MVKIEFKSKFRKQICLWKIYSKVKDWNKMLKEYKTKVKIRQRKLQRLAKAIQVPIMKQKIQSNCRSRLKHNSNKNKTQKIRGNSKQLMIVINRSNFESKKNLRRKWWNWMSTSRCRTKPRIKFRRRCSKCSKWLFNTSTKEENDRIIIYNKN